MQKSFFNKRLVIVLITLIISFLLIAYSISVRNNRNTPSLFQIIGNDVSATLNKVINLPVFAIKGLGSSFINLMDTYQENEKLRSKFDEIVETQVENQTLRRENSKLKQQLKLEQSLTDYQKINAAVLTRTPSSWQNQIVINKGSFSGVTKNSSVISNKGLIGRIIEVNKTNSKVELITTQNESANRFAIQLTDQKGHIINGLITGFDSNKGFLIMGQVTNDNDVKIGTNVISSGLGGIAPKGLFVGKVREISNSGDNSDKKIFISPAANLDDLSVVTVIKRN